MFGIAFFGTADAIRGPWIGFLGKTLPEAGVSPDLCPALEIYDPDFVIDRTTGAFSCLLCMPVRSA
jgi:AraC family transcriptional regulator